MTPASWGGHRHTHSSSAFGADLSELGSPLSPLLSTLIDKWKCVLTLKRDVL